MGDARVPHDPRFRSGPPAAPARVLPAIPAALGELLAEAPAVQVWVKRESEVWRVETAGGPAYLKILDDLDEWADEVACVRWCADHLALATPRVLADAVDERGRGWFLATEVAGTPSHDPDLLGRHPLALVRGLAVGLRRLHDRTPSGSGRSGGSAPACPFGLTVDDLIARAEVRVAAGGVDPSGMRSAFHRSRTAEQLLALLIDTRPDEPASDQVTTHGDPCQPNLLVDRSPSGTVTLVGSVDLGRLAVTDRHRDLAIAIRSLELNLDDGVAPTFLRAYGIDRPDEARLAWWTLVDDLW